jgi:hypothetical protein
VTELGEIRQKCFQKPTGAYIVLHSPIDLDIIPIEPLPELPLPEPSTGELCDHPRVRRREYTIKDRMKVLNGCIGFVTKSFIDNPACIPKSFAEYDYYVKCRAALDSINNRIISDQGKFTPRYIGETMRTGFHQSYIKLTDVAHNRSNPVSIEVWKTLYKLSKKCLRAKLYVLTLFYASGSAYNILYELYNSVDLLDPRNLHDIDDVVKLWNEIKPKKDIVINEDVAYILDI